jgi:thiol-disulfide isomerase/thioredoxin
MNSTFKMQSKHKGALLTALLLASFFSSLAFADNWSLKDTAGVKYKLAEEKGKWVLVNFWAPWCPTCIAELPDLNAMQLQRKDLQVIGVAVLYKNKKEVMDVAQAKSVTYPIVMGDEDIASEFGGMQGMPTSFLYSPTGKLVGHHDGPLTQSEIENTLEQKPESAGLFTN